MSIKWIIRRHTGQTPYKDVILIGVFCFVILLFYFLQIGNLFHLPYRPGSLYSDLTITFFPNIVYVKNSIFQHGQFPLWRTLIFSGSPLDSDPQAGIWYLPNILFLFLPVELGFNVLISGHLLFGGVGMWKWGEAEGLTRTGRLIAVAGFAFMPKMIAHLGFGHLGLFYAAAYIPWLFWSVRKLVTAGKAYSGWFAIVAGMQFLANPQLSFYGLLASGVIVIMVIIREWRGNFFNLYRSLKSRFPPLFAGGLGCLLIVSVQLIPMMRFAPLSGRAGMTLEDSAISSLPWGYLLGFFLQDRQGYMEYMTYIGVPILALLILSVKTWKGRSVLIFGLLAILFALGTRTPFFGLIYTLMPFIGWVRSPARILFYANAVFALIAGYSFDVYLSSWEKSVSNRRILLFFGLAFLPILLVIGYEAILGNPPANVIWMAVVSGVTFGLLWLFEKRLISLNLIRAFLLAVICADLWMLDSTLIEGRSLGQVLGDVRVPQFLQGESEPYRVYSPSYSLPRLAGALYGIETVDGVDPLYWSDYDRFMQVASGVKRTHYEVTIPPMEGEGEPLFVNQGAKPNARMLGMLNVKFVVAEYPVMADGLENLGKLGSRYLYINHYFQPRWSVEFKIGITESFENTLQQINSEALRDTVVIQDPGQVLTPLQPGVEMEYSIHPIRVTPNYLVFEVEIPQEGFFILRQTWHPDWKVFVDGQRGQIYRADGVNMGVHLEGGKHRIAFIYSPIYTYLGGILSLGGWVMVILLVVKGRSGEGRTEKTDI